MTMMVSRIAPLTHPVDADGGSGAGVRGRAARPGRSLPGPERAGREAPPVRFGVRAAPAGRAAVERVPAARAVDERVPDDRAPLVGRPVVAGRAPSPRPLEERPGRGGVRSATDQAWVP
ncbi:hypothetical protein [Humibacillus xanthopallidus]|uniref:hypothetical protein n=1 Tax=Humibacillus xanthopallidus TaxID=412689 RepID=UPI0021AB42A7|nr:hypothetical protein [Humibacillus xanthopallidus]